MEGEEHYLKAGRIAAEVMEKGLGKIKEGAKLLDLAEYVEGAIKEKGGEVAFPVNISINHIAAHYTPDAWDESVFNDGDLVKLDLGAHVKGHIADTAKSVFVGEGDYKIIEASEKGLEVAIDMIKPGATTDKIGAAIQEAIEGMGFHPIQNLTGHKLSPYNLHSGVLVPNIKTRHGDVINEGDVYAIEPFATDGVGQVMDDKNAIIFKYLQNRPLRMKEARIILNHVRKNYATLPFAERWIAKLVPRFKLQQTLRQLTYSKAFYAYHILKEKEHGMVSQAEHTVMVTEDGCVVTTRK